MDITVYLPDELGRWAKDNGVNLSGTLREEVERMREHDEWLKAQTEGVRVHKLYVEDDNNGHTVRLHAKAIASDGRNQTLYVADDGGVYVYDYDAQHLYDMNEAPLEVWQHGNQSFYVAIMHALGEKPVVDVGRA